MKALVRKRMRRNCSLRYSEHKRGFGPALLSDPELASRSTRQSNALASRLLRHSVSNIH